MPTRARVQCFIDGFNLYHAINALNRPHLKWVDLRRVCEIFIDPARHELRDVFYFSAFATWLPGPYGRHLQFVEALKATGTTPIMGHFKSKNRTCKSCGAQWVQHEEKETDVNIALWLLREAYRDSFDQAFILSRDSDLTPAVRMVLGEFSNKRIKMISPPNAGHSKEIGQLVGRHNLVSVKELHLERSLLPATIADPNNVVIVQRPPTYDPP
jgi:hypothetical protein